MGAVHGGCNTHHNRAFVYVQGAGVIQAGNNKYLGIEAACWWNIASLQQIPPSWEALSQHGTRAGPVPSTAFTSQPPAAFRADPHHFSASTGALLPLCFARKVQFQREIPCCSSFLLSSAALIPCQEHFRGACGLPVLRLSQPRSLNPTTQPISV